MAQMHEKSEPAAAPYDELEDGVPMMQQLLDNPFIPLFLGVVVPAMLYVIWGVMEIVGTSSRRSEGGGMALNRMFRVCPMTGLKVHQPAEALIKANAVAAVVSLLALLVTLTRWPAVQLLPPDWYYLLLAARRVFLCEQRAIARNEIFLDPDQLETWQCRLACCCLTVMVVA